MFDVLTSLAATLVQGIEKNITVLVCGQWVVISLEDGCEEEVKIISVS